MNTTTLRLLVFVVLVLGLVLFLIESGEDEAPGAGADVFPALRAVANDVDRISVSRTGMDDVTIERRDGQWLVPSRGDYAADMAKIRDVLLAMTDAKVVETKTADPERHSQLGLDTPLSDASKGVIVTATAGDESFGMVFGNVAQVNYRYARRTDDDQSWLIDQNPDIPQAAGDWLLADIVDVDSDRVRSVTITHADGESISIGKESADDADFEVSDIPAGRELSYSTVANGIGGALNDLDLDDVRVAVDADVSVTTTFETFDDATITVASVDEGDATWIALAIDPPEAGDDGWAAMSDRVSGWQYQVAGYKANLLKRRWEDILKAEEAGEAEE